MNIDELEKLNDEDFAKYVDARAKKKEEAKKAERNAYEALKIDTLIGLSTKASRLNKELTGFKKEAFDSLHTLYKCLQQYSERHADGKGNFTIENEHYKIMFKRQGKASFDERSNQAEKHIMDFLESKYAGDADTKELIVSLLARKNGNLDINLIQKLYKMEDRFDDSSWKKGIALLKESYQYIHSKDYIIFFKKNDKGEWEQISLQFSKV